MTTVSQILLSLCKLYRQSIQGSQTLIDRMSLLLPCFALQRKSSVDEDSGFPRRKEENGRKGRKGAFLHAMRNESEKRGRKTTWLTRGEGVPTETRSKRKLFQVFQSCSLAVPFPLFPLASRERKTRQMTNCSQTSQKTKLLSANVTEVRRKNRPKEPNGTESFREPSVGLGFWPSEQMTLLLLWKHSVDL